MKESGLSEEDAHDRSRWRVATSRGDPIFGNKYLTLNKQTIHLLLFLEHERDTFLMMLTELNINLKK